MNALDGSVVVNGQTGRLWLCKRDEGHALGLRVKMHVDGMAVERLMLFRNAVTPDCAAEARQFGFAEGTMYDIECSICDSRRTWWAGRNAVKRAQKSYVAE